MQAQPTSEHQWLSKLVGEWVFESSCSMGPDQPAMLTKGRETVRSLGGLWTIGEANMGSTESDGRSIMTLGYDPTKKKFVGTFIASMMTHLWPYEGTLDQSGKILTLDSEGPSFATEGAYAKYQDSIEFVDDNHRILSSRMLLPDGQWVAFMEAHYHRVFGS
ncbi:MAG: DUF1579 domain-containing protein [Planctomycetaceae bacterium]|nr:DUF1579 domain-containing protein [Planctomycetaceae bacterium]